MDLNLDCSCTEDRLVSYSRTAWMAAVGVLPGNQSRFVLAHINSRSHTVVSGKYNLGGDSEEPVVSVALYLTEMALEKIGSQQINHFNESLIRPQTAPGDSVCWSPGVTSCTECLRRGPQCAWCFKEDFLDGAGQSQRCDLPVKLLRRGCEAEFMEQSEIKVEVNATISSTQVSPQDISVTLRPGSEASIVVAVKQLERYPVDLYYLVDVSASMQENLDHVGVALSVPLKTVGVALSLRMTEHSSDLWLGFGSFVDKPVSPYINVHPSKIHNPCRQDTEFAGWIIDGFFSHGFHHVLSMMGNVSEFTRVIKRQRISGNMDTPEGGLDAMLQAAVCQRAVGWRPEAKRLLLLMTDQPSHLALDSRLAGIVTPHDGLCHLENNVYTGSTQMDHPSLGQLSDKLLENHIYSIFAVEKQQYQWYQELVRLLPGSFLGKLGLFQAPNLIELVVDAYKRLLSEVEVSVSVEDKAVSRYWVSVSPLCPDGSTAKGQSCSGVQPNQTVYFNITIGLRSCPEDGEDEDVTVLVRPVGYNESTVVRIHSKCRCSCGPTKQCNDDNQSPCSGIQDSPNQERWQGHGLIMDSNRDLNWNCRADGTDVDCSGRGVCECGRECVDCHLSHGFAQKEAGHCNSTCASLVGYMDDVSGQAEEMWIQCMYISNDSCRYRFQTSSRSECGSSSSRLVGTFLSVCALTVLCGLVVVAVSRLLLQKRDGSPGGTAEDGGYHCTEKDLSYIPTTNEKTVTYRRDRPPDRSVEMHIQVSKMPLGDPWQY
ncbi:Integrin beta-8 [Collichthys lucidus]|uniref:Integrin beta n=1 Tax=Collichthys lucidus TaxID=240159 RepID=A0A4U5VJH5_COLLU|nr:Integrin beta-8 [Collichthys lucidus]